VARSFRHGRMSFRLCGGRVGHAVADVHQRIGPRVTRLAHADRV
jgi:hypothetical protein